jgi:serine/threonine protein kinase
MVTFKANVLIDNYLIPQICDFGLVSIFLEEGSSGMTTTSPHTGTDRYLAYELVLDEEQAGPTMASDIFALGGIGLEVFILLNFSLQNDKAVLV